MMADVIVFGTVALAVTMVVAWCLRPDLRVWMEQPKHRFQDDLRRYDESYVESGFSQANVESGFSRTQGTSDTDRPE
jgi:hypothetical protein